MSKLLEFHVKLCFTVPTFHTLFKCFKCSFSDKESKLLPTLFSCLRYHKNLDQRKMTLLSKLKLFLTAEAIGAPWIYQDTSDLEPGKRYTYTAIVEQNGNPSSESIGKLECTKPAQPDPNSIYAISNNSTAITAYWTVSEGQFLKK